MPAKIRKVLENKKKSNEKMHFHPIFRMYCGIMCVCSGAKAYFTSICFTSSFFSSLAASMSAWCEPG